LFNNGLIFNFRSQDQNRSMKSSNIIDVEAIENKIKEEK
jgi:hypothetical protein